jgi:hypothetical protein
MTDNDPLWKPDDDVPAQLEVVESLSKKQLREKINHCFWLADTRGNTERQGHIAEAQFYMSVLDRRHDSWISTRDLILEVIVILLIGGEIILGYYQGRDEARAAALQYKVLSHLETSSGATAENLKTLNEKLQNEVDFYYEPSVYLTYTRDKGQNDLELHNNTRTNVTLFAAQINPKNTCVLDAPIGIGFGGSRRLTWSVLDRVMQSVTGSDAPRNVSLYIRTENGKDYHLDAAFDRWSQGYEIGLTVRDLGMTKVDWKREYAEVSKKPFANKQCTE